MFDLNDKTLTRVDSNSTPVDRLPEAKAPSDKPTPANRLDSSQITELHARLLSYYRQEIDRQSENRYEMAKDEDYYDSIQWSEEEAAALKDRGQAPIVYNVLAQTINWVIGSEKRGRTDYKILPRGKEDAKPAELKTKLLKYISDVNRLPFHRSRAFEDAIKVGIGWMEDGAQDDDDGEPIYSRYESWRNILHDSASTELDMSDARYVFRTKWVDLDVAQAIFPERAAQLEDAVMDSSVYGSFDQADGDIPMDMPEFDRGNTSTAGTLVTHQRKRLRIIEAEYRAPERVQRLRGGVFKGEIYDPTDQRHVEAVQNGYSKVYSKVMMRVRIAIFTTKDMLYEGPSPYRHNRFRFTPIWCFRRGRDNLPYGMIRQIRDIQDDINKRASKALHILSSNKVIMDEGALPDGVSIDEFAEEVSRPDAIIVKRQGKELVINAERDLAAPHLELMSRSINMIQQVGGVTDELLGRTTNAVSGVAVQRRQEQGSLATNKPFDNLRLATQMQGELQLSLLEQFCTEAKTFRITNERGVPAFVDVNDGLPANDITRTKADFIVGEADWRATMRQAAAEQLMEIIGKMPPQVAIMLLDLAVDAMDLPNREEIAKRIRSVNNQKDPDQTEPTPEDIAKEQAAQKQAAFQEAVAQTELENKQADTALKLANVLKLHVGAQREQNAIVGDKVTAANTAMTAATQVIAMPTIAKVADGILRESGWGKDSVLPPLPGMNRPPIPQPQPQPDIQDVQPRMQEPAAPAPAPSGSEIAPPAPMPAPMPVPRPAMGMPPAQPQQSPLAMLAGAQESQAISAMKDMQQGTIAALTQVTQAIASMAEAMKTMEKPKNSKVIIEKTPDGKFVGRKVEE